MFGGLIAAVVVLFTVNQWAKEDVEEKKRRNSAKSNYYVDKWGNWRHVSTGRKITGEDVARDLERGNRAWDLRFYNMYKEGIESMNKHAEEHKASIEEFAERLGHVPKYDYLCLKQKILSFDEWMEEKKKYGTVRSFVIKDDIFYKIPLHQQKFYEKEG